MLVLISETFVYWIQGFGFRQWQEIVYFFMLISPCIVNQFFKMFQQDGAFFTVFYSLQTALHVSGETFTHHQELE
jgi:hypothetical protein